MPWEDEQVRKKISERARRSRQYGEFQDVLFPVGPTDPKARANALFIDQTGQTIIGFGTMAMMRT